MVRIIDSYKPESIFLGDDFFCLEANHLKTQKKFDSQETKKVALYFISFIAKLLRDDFSSAYDRDLHSRSKNHLLQTASLFLRANLQRYKEKKVGSKEKDDDLLHTLVKLDRYLAAVRFSSLVFSQAPPSQESVEKLFITEQARSHMRKWLALKTHIGLKHKMDGSGALLVDSERGHLAFLSRPEEIDFLFDKGIFKDLSRLSEKIDIDPITFCHKILYHGEKVSVSDVIKQHKEDDVVFREGEGIVRFDRSMWTELPVFRRRKKAQGKDDYKLVIKTINEGSHHHSWLELKTPEHVYNVGYAWASGSSIGSQCGSLPSLETIPGSFFVPDKEELCGKDDKFVKTVCRITEEQFLSLKNFIETKNSAQPLPYNLTASNCCTFTREISASIGLAVESRENGARFLTGKHITLPFQKTSFLGKLVRSFHHLLALFRNVLFYLFGGARSQLPNARGAIFSNFYDIFDSNKGLYDYPQRIYEWQMAVKEQREKQACELQASPHYLALSDEDKIKALKELAIKLPLDVKIEEPEDTI